jgi:hypothetical protein
MCQIITSFRWRSIGLAQLLGGCFVVSLGKSKETAGWHCDNNHKPIVEMIAMALV